MKLLVYPQISDTDAARIQTSFPELEIIRPRSEGEALGYVVDAEVLYGSITPDLLMTAQNLKWVQANCIGMENYIFPELVDSEVRLTNVRGVFSDHIANQVWAYILSFSRGLHRYMRRQVAHNWDPAGDTVTLADATLGIVGLGGIGQEVAARASAFGTRVIAVDPQVTDCSDHVDSVTSPENLDEMLREADFVVICAPHASGTERMFSTHQLATMKNSAYLINIGRGIIVDLNALTTALQDGSIAGAALDVYETEPLPSDHPLWDMDNTILTPHMAGHGPYVQERRIAVFIENMTRYLRREPFITEVNKQHLY